MNPHQLCLDALRGFIERADRGELAQAQAAIIQFALGFPDLKARSDAMAELQRSLAEDAGSRPPGSSQAAYHAVVDAMIDRTREAVLDTKATQPSA